MWPFVAIIAAWETFWYLWRMAARGREYQAAQQQAALSGLPLVVVGAPDGGFTQGPGCGDVCIDIEGCACPMQIKADITKPLPFDDDSCVVFVSCVLEYVDDLDAAMLELVRISGGRLHIVGVEPWTLTAYLYPGAKRTLPDNLRS